jgi:hypothetical protein
MDHADVNHCRSTWLRRREQIQLRPPPFAPLDGGMSRNRKRGEGERRQWVNEAPRLCKPGLGEVEGEIAGLLASVPTWLLHGGVRGKVPCLIARPDPQKGAQRKSTVVRLQVSIDAPDRRRAAPRAGARKTHAAGNRRASEVSAKEAVVMTDQSEHLQGVCASHDAITTGWRCWCARRTNTTSTCRLRRWIATGRSR